MYRALPLPPSGIWLVASYFVNLFILMEFEKASNWITYMEEVGGERDETQVKVVGNKILPYFLEIFFHIAWSQSFQCSSSFSSLILQSLSRYRSLHTSGQRLARRLAESNWGMAVKQENRSHLALQSNKKPNWVWIYFFPSLLCSFLSCSFVISLVFSFIQSAVKSYLLKMFLF